MIFMEGFTGDEVFDGDRISATHAGFMFEASIILDDNAKPPWVEHDGHGPVREVHFPYGGDVPKRGGERILDVADYSVYLYDWEAAVKLALKNNWGTHDGRQKDETRRQYANRAVEEDFKHLERWCNKEWLYVGVMVDVQRDGIDLTDAFAHAVWGIESTSVDYINATANDLAEQALVAARDKLLSLCTYGLRDIEDGNAAMEIARADERNS